MIESGEGITMMLWFIVAVIALVPSTIFLVSYIRVKSKKLLIITIAFFLFFIKAMILVMKLFMPNYSDEIWWSVAAILDIIIVSLIAYSLAKKT